MQMVAEDGKIPTAADVLGTIGTALWSIQLIPQIWYNWTKKNTEGLPASMMFIWALSTCSSPDVFNIELSNGTILR